MYSWWSGSVFIVYPPLPLKLKTLSLSYLGMYGEPEGHVAMTRHLQDFCTSMKTTIAIIIYEQRREECRTARESFCEIFRMWRTLTRVQAPVYTWGFRWLIITSSNGDRKALFFLTCFRILICKFTFRAGVKGENRLCAQWLMRWSYISENPNKPDE